MIIHFVDLKECCVHVLIMVMVMECLKFVHFMSDVLRLIVHVFPVCDFCVSINFVDNIKQLLRKLSKVTTYLVTSMGSQIHDTAGKDIIPSWRDGLGTWRG